MLPDFVWVVYPSSARTNASGSRRACVDRIRPVGKYLIWQALGWPKPFQG